MTDEQREQARKRTIEYLDKAGIITTPEERARIQVFDFGLEDLEHLGLQLLVYVNTPRVCAKEMVLFPWQTCVEHWHPTIGEVSGKEETFRCRWGKVFLCVPGEPTKKLGARVPENGHEYFTVLHEIELAPGQQYTLEPDTPHWFQGGPDGAVISEFSTTNTDDIDVFRDPRIKQH
jgi:D-lyxose ketol-isomerase